MRLVTAQHSLRERGHAVAAPNGNPADLWAPLSRRLDVRTATLLKWLYNFIGVPQSNLGTHAIEAIATVSLLFTLRKGP
jgi:hypothetical protein